MNWRTATVCPSGNWYAGKADCGDGWLRRVFARLNPGPIARSIIRFRVQLAQEGRFTSDAAVARYLGCSHSYARMWRRLMVRAGVLMQAPQKHRYTAVGWRSYPLVVRLSDVTRSLIAQARRFAARRRHFARRPRTPIEQIKTFKRVGKATRQRDLALLAARFGSWIPVLVLAPPGRA